MFTQEQAVSMPVMGLDFLWLEINRRCNMECLHCYNSSSPLHKELGKLTEDECKQVILSAASIGCKRIQIIGGEPTLEPYLPDLIALAHSTGFEFIEVYTNALSISDSLISCFKNYGVHIATSFYSSDALVHVTVTTVKGSQAATSKTIVRLIAAGVPVRASLIVMEHNQHTVDDTVRYLKTLGVEDIGFDNVRGVDRGRKQTASTEVASSPVSKLCGHCWKGSLCVAYNGNVYPCIMSECLLFGSVRDHSIAQIVEGEALQLARRIAFTEAYIPKLNAQMENCAPQACCPGGIHKSNDIALSQNCAPQACCPGGIHKSTVAVAEGNCAPQACCPGGIHKSAE